MNPRLSGYISILGLVFFEPLLGIVFFESLLGIVREWRRENLQFLSIHKISNTATSGNPS